MNKSSLRDFRESFRREVVTLTRNSLHDGYINCINNPFLWRDTLVQLAFQKFDTGKHGSLSVMTRNVHSNQLVASVNLRDQGVGMARNSQSARGHGILRFDAFTCLTDGGDDV